MVASLILQYTGGQQEQHCLFLITLGIIHKAIIICLFFLLTVCSTKRIVNKKGGGSDQWTVDVAVYRL